MGEYFPLHAKMKKRSVFLGFIIFVVVVLSTKKVMAIDIATVNIDIITLAAWGQAVADVSWRIGAALMTLAVIGYVFKKFIIQ